MSFTTDQRLEYPPVQDDWRYCNKCHAMFFNSDPDKGICPKDGRGHDGSGSFNFRLIFNIVPDWRYCNKCHVMFYDGWPDKGICPAGGAHTASGFDFGLVFEVSGGQQNWRYCTKCSALFYYRDVDQGICPKDGKSHDGSDSSNFILVYDNIEGPHFAPNGQPDWRYCAKCHTMFFNGYPDKGVCPKDGGGHDGSSSFNFVLRHDEIGGPVQQNWRYCTKCHALFFDEYSPRGVCPKDGEGHTAAGFYFYLVFDNPAAGQPDWRYCTKCHVLFYNGYYPDNGVCPKDGGGHDGSGSFNFTPSFGDPPVVH